jgi:MFS family permease
MSDPSAPSYRALLTVPSLGRALLGTQIARIGQAMVGVAMVLFTLTEYDSPALAGVVTFASIAPGLVVSPIAGALLDRHGRTRLIVADFLIAMSALSLIGLLALADRLPVWLLLLISVLGSLTGPLSATGLRTLFPLMAPRHLWERLNAVDSNGYVVASIVGPPIAALGVGLLGGPIALVAIGLVYGLAALILARVPEPPHDAVSSGHLLVDAWQGLVYTWRNRTLRALGFSITVSNLANGMVSIVVPLIVLERLGLAEVAVGAVFAVQGVFGLLSGFAAGRLDTRGRERPLIAIPTLLMVPPTALLLLHAGIAPVVASMALVGIVIGPLDVAMFTLRQRRTDPAWMGRAFAVSMSFNFAGYPVGAAIAGSLAGLSIDLAIVCGLVALVAGGILAAVMIPAEAPDAAEARPGARV